MTSYKGRVLQGANNNYFAFAERSEIPNRLVCPECQCLLDPFYRSLRITCKTNLDFSATYDGVHIVSERFKNFVQANGYSNVIFFPVNEKLDFFYFHILNSSAKIDLLQSGIKKDEECSVCRLPRNIYGGGVLFLQDSEILEDGFYTSDLYWRTQGTCRPKQLVGIKTYEKLKAQNFKGLDMIQKVF